MANVTTDILAIFANKFAQKVTDIFAKKTDIPDSLPADGGNAETVNGHTVNTDVPEDAKFTDTTYTLMSGASANAAGKSGLVPAPTKGTADRYLCADGTFKKPEEATTEDIDNIIAGIFKEE